MIKDGKIISENYYRGNKENSLVINMSITKSVTSLLIGIAYEDEDTDYRRIKMFQTITDYNQ